MKKNLCASLLLLITTALSVVAEQDKNPQHELAYFLEAQAENLDLKKNLPDYQERIEKINQMKQKAQEYNALIIDRINTLNEQIRTSKETLDKIEKVEEMEEKYQELLDIENKIEVARKSILALINPITGEIDFKYDPESAQLLSKSKELTELLQELVEPLRVIKEEIETKGTKRQEIITGYIDLVQRKDMEKITKLIHSLKKQDPILFVVLSDNFQRLQSMSGAAPSTTETSATSTTESPETHESLLRRMMSSAYSWIPGTSVATETPTKQKIIGKKVEESSRTSEPSRWERLKGWWGSEPQTTAPTQQPGVQHGGQPTKEQENGDIEMKLIGEVQEI
ncbi:hypothetical protein KJZ61_04335 [Candidatus Dependentiae bacterium]|nr:hypothetical protein [Candidatus Dependentiae bacterium]